MAVSGGADSLALLLLTAAWAKRHRLGAPTALTVDHGLRKESAAEAARVADWARWHAVPHVTLSWTGRKPAKNIQALAREARYRLLGERMRATRIAVLLTGHTRDDQAETFLLRLARGSGLDGLSGMAAVAPFPIPEYPDLRIARPLLGFTHERLMATLRARKQTWLADPSNDSERFARVQIRKLMPALGAAGVTRDRIADAAHHLQRAKDAVDTAVKSLIEGAQISHWGYALLDPSRFGAAPDEVALRALARMVEALGGAPYPPRFEQTQAVLAWLTSAKPTPKGRTLGGCRLARRDDGRVLLAREEAALAREDPVLLLKAGESGVWDRRFDIALSQAPAGARFEVRRLGPQGLKHAGPKAAMPPIEPHRLAATVPALWRGGRLAAAPLLGIETSGVAVSLAFSAVARVVSG